MNSDFVEQSVKGVVKKIPAIVVDGFPVIVSGRWLRIAYINDEEWLDRDVSWDPKAFISKMRQAGVKADIFSFSQHFPHTAQSFDYPLESENVAAIATKSYQDWWEQKLPQETRKNVRRSAKRGVEVRVVQFDDELVAAISKIYNETPFRQGRRFWHYNKDLAAVKKDNSTYLDRAEFIGAYCEGQLIGFIKMVYVRGIANLMQILASNHHQDKRPMNALLAKAVEVCGSKGVSHLVYSKYDYNRKKESALAEFKRRNGFEKFLYPYYYVPLTLRGSVAVRLKLYRGIMGLIPGGLMDKMVAARAWVYERFRPVKPATVELAQREEG